MSRRVMLALAGAAGLHILLCDGVGAAWMPPEATAKIEYNIIIIFSWSQSGLAPWQRATQSFTQFS